MTLGGYICVRNGDEGDYCWRQAAASLLPVVDELILCDSDSTDGTREAMDRWADKEPKIKVINYPWPAPQGDGKWWVKWLNYAREHLTSDFQITVDADEILSDHPDCHAAIREALAEGTPRTFNRLNFWKDASHLIPEGHAIGKWVTRIGPKAYWMPSDEGHPAGELPILNETKNDSRLEIFHLGFLRRKDAFWKKARVVLGAFFNTYDSRLEALEAADKPLADVQNCEWTNQLVPWQGYMPDAAQRWLSARGHTTNHYLGMNEQEAYKRVRVSQPPPKGETLNVLVVGDLGDLIYGMAVFRAIGRVHLFARDANHLCKRIIHRMPLIAPLLESQRYITGFEEHTDQEIHWNAGDFRSEHDLTRSLSLAHLQHYRGNLDLPRIHADFSRPWITGISPDPTGRNRIIINRTNRYNNRHFRWSDIVRHYGRALLFVGTQEEHLAFCNEFGPVEYRATQSLLDVAQLIAASPLFIGNQSACYALAEGMKAPRLLEVCLFQPDVITAPDPNARLSADGTLDLPTIAGRPPLKCPASLANVNYLKNPATQPRTGWKVGPPYTRQEWADVSHSTLLRKVMHFERLDEKTAHKALFDALAAREPSYFFDGQANAELRLFQEALRNAAA